MNISDTSFKSVRVTPGNTPGKLANVDAILKSGELISGYMQVWVNHGVLVNFKIDGMRVTTAQDREYIKSIYDTCKNYFARGMKSFVSMDRNFNCEDKNVLHCKRCLRKWVYVVNAYE